MEAHLNIVGRLKKELQNFPRSPGVYLMKDANGEVIYVGKARDLRARVRSYFNKGGDGRYQIKFLLRRVYSIDKIVTESENQAFTLERDLITKYKPRYNIRLKDDRSFLSIRIDRNVAWPKLQLVRRVEQDGALYFGPYSFTHELRSLLEVVNRVVPLRTCSDAVFYNRQRPCLEYQIKRCAGPCCLKVDKEEYQEWVSQAIDILEGKTDRLEKQLEEQMRGLSEGLHFEIAAVVRDRIEVLRSTREGQKFVSNGAEDRDVFALHRDERLATLSVLKVRYGRVVDSSNFSFSDVEVEDSEVLESALEQFYETGREVPEEIVVSSPLLDQGFVKNKLKEKRGGAVKITFPRRGLKYRLLNLALLNARQHFIARFDSDTRYQEISKVIAQKFKLKQLPRRIECVDISNLQGSDIVGAVVVFVDGQSKKSEYKRYKISEQGKPDDFSSIHEVVSRRLQRAQIESDLPDLLVIDGGPGQLAMALEARNTLGVELDIVSLAKMRTLQKGGVDENKPERVYLEGVKEALVLEPGKELTRFMQRVRDEAHRYVISYHRSSRSKRVIRSVLDEIPGIGPERRKRLLKSFGSVENIKVHSLEEIARAGRMSKKLAQKVIEYIEKD